MRGPKSDGQNVLLKTARCRKTKVAEVAELKPKLYCSNRFWSKKVVDEA